MASDFRSSTTRLATLFDYSVSFQRKPDRTGTFGEVGLSNLHPLVLLVDKRAQTKARVHDYKCSICSAMRRINDGSIPAYCFVRRFTACSHRYSSRSADHQSLMAAMASDFRSSTTRLATLFDYSVSFQRKPDRTGTFGEAGLCPNLHPLVLLVDKRAQTKARVHDYKCSICSAMRRINDGSIPAYCFVRRFTACSHRYSSLLSKGWPAASLFSAMDFQRPRLTLLQRQLHREAERMNRTSFFAPGAPASTSAQATSAQAPISPPVPAAQQGAQVDKSLSELLSEASDEAARAAPPVSAPSATPPPPAQASPQQLAPPPAAPSIRVPVADRSPVGTSGQTDPDSSDDDLKSSVNPAPAKAWVPPPTPAPRLVGEYADDDEENDSLAPPQHNVCILPKKFRTQW